MTTATKKTRTYINAHLFLTHVTRGPPATKRKATPIFDAVRRIAKRRDICITTATRIFVVRPLNYRINIANVMVRNRSVYSIIIRIRTVRWDVLLRRISRQKYHFETIVWGISRYVSRAGVPNPGGAPPRGGVVICQGGVKLSRFRKKKYNYNN